MARLDRYFVGIGLSFVIVVVLFWLNYLHSPNLETLQKTEFDHHYRKIIVPPDFFVVNDSKPWRLGPEKLLLIKKRPSPNNESKVKVELPNEQWNQTVNEQCQILKPEERFDCFPENTVTLSGCLARGCCWQPTSARKKPTHTGHPSDPQAPVDVPYCYYPKNYPGYTVTSQTVTDTGFQATLQRYTTTHYPRDVMKLMMDVKYETATRLHIKLYDPAVKRYEVPIRIRSCEKKAVDTSYSLSVSSPGEPFSLTVKRKGSSRQAPPIFSTSGAAPLMFTDQYLQLSTFLPTHYIYGLGQHRDRLLHSTNWTRYTMWNRDQAPVENVNLYGSHPFYLAVENGGISHGFFLLNSNAMDVILQPAPAITWRTIGGVLDFYLFLGPSPENVVQQYSQLIGQSFMPPYWSLGLHVCRFGYKTVNDTMAVVNQVRKYGIPQDVMWNDIDYAVDGLDFTTDVKKFGNQSAMVDELHSRGMHYVILLDPGISNEQPTGTYPPFDLGMKYGLFVRNDTGQPAVGRNWPGDIVWPDFSHPATKQYWTTLIRTFHDKVKIDGLWLDMDEVSSFSDGSPVTGCLNNSLNYPPYLPAVEDGVLHKRSMCPSAQHHSSSSYNLHSIYNVQEVKTTYKSLISVRGRRPFIISRATFPGMSKYGGHWSGDNAATFYDMYKSISELLSMSISGVAMTGSDICGFRFNTTAQLCQRWYQLGAFYPFSRNHNDHLGNIAQDPGAFGAVFAASVRKVYLTRYSLIPYLYTLLYQCHITGNTVARPLFFEFPDDMFTYNLDRQLLWGPALLISPVLEENATTVEAYFPSGVWYDFYTGSKIGKERSVVKLNAPLDVINLHVRGGFIIPMQEPSLTTTESRKNKFWLLVALDKSQTARGQLYWDDGDTVDSHQSGMFDDIQFTATKGVLSSTVQFYGLKSSLLLSNVTIFGVEFHPDEVMLNGSEQQFMYNDTKQVLRVPFLSPSVNLLEQFKLTWK